MNCLPNIEKMEKQEGDSVPNMLEKVGELGLLGSHMPERFGGMELDTNTNTFICDAMGPSGSFSTTFAAHTGIGMLANSLFWNRGTKTINIYRV